jgi:hypothetical protein
MSLNFGIGGNPGRFTFALGVFIADAGTSTRVLWLQDGVASTATKIVESNVAPVKREISTAASVA